MLLHQEILPQYTINIIEAQYAIGTPLLLTPFIAALGNQGVFLFSILCFLASYFFVLGTIKILGYDDKGVLLFFVFIPLLFIVRTIMSELPSLLIVSLAIYVLAQNKKRLYWLVFVLGGVSIVFRETNAIIFGPILLYIFFRSDIQKKILYAFTFAMSLTVRLFTNYVFYGDAFHLKKGYPFSLSYIDNNLLLYFLILFVFIPAGIVVFLKYKGVFSKLFFSIILIFTVVHLCYGYNGMDFSGFKMGMILNGRFYIPLIPIFCIQVAWFFTKINMGNKTTIAAYTVSILIAISSQFYLHTLSSSHYNIASYIDQYKDKVLIFDHTLHSNIGRYINPFLNNLHSTLDISRLEHPSTLDSLHMITNEAYIVQSERQETEAKLQRKKDILKLIKASSLTLELDTTLYTGDGGIITFSKIITPQ